MEDEGGERGREKERRRRRRALRRKIGKERRSVRERKWKGRK